MNKKLFLIIGLVAMMLFVFGIAGCGGTDTVAPVEEEPENGEEPAEEVEVVVLDFAHPFPAAHHHHVDIIVPFVEEIMEKSEGRVVINLHPGGSITTGTSAIDDVSTGAVDMIWTLQGYTAGRFPLTEMIEFFDHFNSAEEATATIWGLLEQNEEFQEEYGDFKVFNMYTTDIGDVYTSNKPIQKPSDLQGVSLRSASPMVDKSLSRFGATTAGMPMPDAYDNIERGVVDGMATGASAIPTYRLYEVLSYATEGMNLYVSPQVMAMSWDAWNRLTPEDQALFETIGGRELSLKSARYYDELHEWGVTSMQEEGMEVYFLSPEEKALFAELAAPVVEDYIAELTGRGYDAQGFYDLMISIRDSLR
ncbi:MAG: TRAP transporter substrate-binding protein [Bacillota bacterium]|nr:TRAP transporter substrate-binding protein [Bacillota bacterium]